MQAITKIMIKRIKPYTLIPAIVVSSLALSVLLPESIFEFIVSLLVLEMLFKIGTALSKICKNSKKKIQILKKCLNKKKINSRTQKIRTKG